MKREKIFFVDRTTMRNIPLIFKELFFMKLRSLVLRLLYVRSITFGWHRKVFENAWSLKTSCAWVGVAISTDINLAN